MARFARLDPPGVLNHVIIRGMKRRKLFRDGKDRDNLLDRLGDLLPATNTRCYAWALLPNHAHFLFRRADIPLSTLMRRLLTGYAVSFNRRHRCHGPLFQNRYKSVICEEDVYLKELVRYIHLNPLRARIVSGIAGLNRYEYSGHCVLMGREHRPWQETGHVLSYFGKSTEEARRKYLRYVRGGVDQGRRPDLVGGGLIRSVGGWGEIKKIRLTGQESLKGDQRILGSSDFVMAVLAGAGERLNPYYELRRLGYDLETIEKRVCKLYRIGPEELFSKSRQKIRADARSLYCYWAARELGYSLTDLARRLGMTQPGVGYAVNRGERIARENKYKLKG